VKLRVAVAVAETKAMAAAEGMAATAAAETEGVAADLGATDPRSACRAVAIGGR
jgi:hypothetical protein